MSSREQILNALKKNQPARLPLPEVTAVPVVYADPVEKFTTVLRGIGATVIEVNDPAEIVQYIQRTFPMPARIVSVASQLSINIGADFTGKPHSMENVDLAVLEGQFGVAENGAVWVTDQNMGDRALPFITAHLALLFSRGNIVNTMQDAYQRIGTTAYAFGTFIAGPSKTADIEQSLVLGAHGPKSLAVFLLP